MWARVEQLGSGAWVASRAMVAERHAYHSSIQTIKQHGNNYSEWKYSEKKDLAYVFQLQQSSRVEITEERERPRSFLVTCAWYGA